MSFTFFCLAFQVNADVRGSLKAAVTTRERLEQLRIKNKPQFIFTYFVGKSFEEEFRKMDGPHSPHWYRIT